MNINSFIFSLCIFLKVVIFAIWPQVQPLTGPARRAGWPCHPALGCSPSGCPETHCAAAGGGKSWGFAGAGGPGGSPVGSACLGAGCRPYPPWPAASSAWNSAWLWGFVGVGGTWPPGAGCGAPCPAPGAHLSCPARISICLGWHIDMLSSHCYACFNTVMRSCCAVLVAYILHLEQCIVSIF